MVFINNENIESADEDAAVTMIVMVNCCSQFFADFFEKYFFVL